jgi:serine/threonine protein kinase
MLYGTVPFKANNMKDLHKQIIEARYNLKDEITSEAKDLIKSLLNPDPNTRYTI